MRPTGDVLALDWMAKIAKRERGQREKLFLL
uniref:Uncharacterized protein n=1 Tax=Nelumbo nucifera TaxID=4432 RepID=A0A822XS52_NELNU|nr:TPA_asm: hypothetical protein HUJ06_023434 [Nelumbo nucifera]